MLTQSKFAVACEMFGSDFCAELLNTQGSSGADWLAHSVQKNRDQTQAKGNSIQLTKEKQTDDIEQLFFAESEANKSVVESKYASKFFGSFEVDASSQKSYLKPDTFFGWQSHETKEKSRVDVVNHMFLKG